MISSKLSRTPAVLPALSVLLLCPSLQPVPAQAAPRKTTKKAVKKARPTPALKARPGYIAGRVTNAAGKPLSGATVGIYGTTMAGANTRFEAITNAAGQYSQRLPEGIYGASAYYKVKYNNRNYNFTLAPKDGTTSVKHDSARGFLKDFVWKISGLKPGAQPSGADTGAEALKYYGGYIYLTSREEGFGGDRVYFPANSTLVVTLTPRGKLIDGSIGRPKTFKRPFDKDIKFGIATHLMDIPVGLYSLKASLQLPDGTSKALGVQMAPATAGSFKPSLNVDFEPTGFGDMQLMQVTVEP